MLLLTLPSPLTGGLQPPGFNEALYNVFYGFPGGYRGALTSLFSGDVYRSFGWLGVLLGVGWAMGVHGLSLCLGPWPPPLRMALAFGATYAAAMVGCGRVYNSSARFLWTSLCQMAVYRRASGTSRHRAAAAAAGSLIARARA
jgi:hypothetical protein